MGLKYLAGYSPAVVEKVQALIDNDQLAVYLQKKYPQAHQIKTMDVGAVNLGGINFYPFVLNPKFPVSLKN